MRKILFIAAATAVLLVAIGCGTASSPPSVTPTGSLSDVVNQGELGDTLAVGPLKITPTKMQRSGDDGSATYSGTPRNGEFVSVYMKWENVSDGTVTDFPVSVILNSDAITYGISMVEGPTPSLSADWTDMPPHAKIEGWLTFDMSGDPAKLVTRWRQEVSDAVGTWMLD